MVDVFANINLLYWLNWFLIGLLLAMYISKPYYRRKVIFATLFLGITGSFLGGLGSCMLFGYGTAQYFIISDFAALLVAGIILWVTITLLVKKK